MERPDWKSVLRQVYDDAVAHLTGTPDTPAGTRTDVAAMRDRLGGPLPVHSENARAVVARLAKVATAGLTRSTSGRFFGFAVGGASPAALGADWLTATWDQNAVLAGVTPAAAAVEIIAGDWMKEMFGLPAAASVGFVTGGQMANFTALAAARTEVLRRAGWDVGARGLHGAPAIRVLAGEQRHHTIDRAVRFLGLGDESIVAVAADDQGRMRPDALADALRAGAGPAIVCAQAGGINTGAFDPFAEIVDVAHAAGAWVHVDGAFGLWAAASPRLRTLLAGFERADSWATDAHKWLNVPFDCGVVFCAAPAAHRAAMSMQAVYLEHGGPDDRDPIDYVPELSRRARGFPVYAALRALGSGGVRELVEGSCELAGRFASRLGAAPGVEILNDVVLNQVLVRFAGPDERTTEVIQRVQDDGTCYVSGTRWQGRPAMRISVMNWATDENDVEESVTAILRCNEE
jgi:glutamate/tyrosine decarboxylase-like PLP-dependent enzyme